MAALLTLACVSSASVVWAQAAAAPGVPAPQDAPFEAAPVGDLVRPLGENGVGSAAVPVPTTAPTFELPARTSRSALDDPIVLMVLATSAAVLVTALLGLAVLMLVRRRAAGSPAPASVAAPRQPVAEVPATPPAAVAAAFEPALEPDPRTARVAPRAPPPPLAVAGGRPEARLLDAEGVTGRDSINIVADTVLLGRSKQNAQTGVQVVTIGRGTVGRRHAVIEYRNHAFHLVDQGSVNGTLLNGERILAPTVLHHGDVIRLESVELTFSFPMEPVAAPTVIAAAAAAEEEITRIGPALDFSPAAASGDLHGGQHAAVAPVSTPREDAEETGANITIAPEFEARAERRAGLIDRYLEPEAPALQTAAPAAAARGGLIASALGMPEDESARAAGPAARAPERPDARPVADAGQVAARTGAAAGTVAGLDPRAADTADEPLGTLERESGEASGGSDGADDELREEASRTLMDPDVAAIFAAQSDDSLRDDDTTGPEAGFATTPRVRAGAATDDAPVSAAGSGPTGVTPASPGDAALVSLTVPAEVDFPLWVDANDVPADARQTGVGAEAPADDGQADVTGSGDNEDSRSTEGLLGADSAAAERADSAARVGAALPPPDFDHQSTRRFETPPDNRPAQPLPPPKAVVTLAADPEDEVPAPAPTPPRPAPSGPAPSRPPQPTRHTPPAAPGPAQPTPAPSPVAPPAARRDNARDAAEDLTDRGALGAEDEQRDASDVSYLLDVDPTVARVAAPPARPRAWLVDVDAVTRTPRFEVSTDVVIIGRSAPTRVTGRQYLTIRRNTIGRRHATLRYDGAQFTVEDHQSINGTYLNGERVVSVVSVPAGSEIVFDEFRFRFEVEPPGTVRDEPDEPDEPGWDATVLFGTPEDGSRGRS